MITVKNRKESKFKAEIAPKKHKIAEKGLKKPKSGVKRGFRRGTRIVPVTLSHSWTEK